MAQPVLGNSSFSAAKGLLGYAVQSVVQHATPGSATWLDMTSLSVAVVVDVRRIIRITLFGSLQMGGTGAGDDGVNSIRIVDELGNVLASGGQSLSGSIGSRVVMDVLPAIVDAPTAGAHIYKGQARSSCSTGEFYSPPGLGGGPNYILIEDIGQSPT